MTILFGIWIKDKLPLITIVNYRSNRLILSSFKIDNILPVTFRPNLSIFYLSMKSRTSDSSVEKLIGSSIARIRKDRELTQAQLAEIIDTTVETISRLERGVSVPSLKTLEKISKALHVHIKELLDFESPSLKKPSIREGEKLFTYLQTRRPEDIEMCYRILKSIFEQIEKNYQPKR